VTVREVVCQLERAAGTPDLIELGAVPSRPGEPPKLVADTRKLRDEVPFTPRVPLPEGAARTVAWWRGRL
jgi:nucleoside-diphosphate-sugar epimerase